MTISEKLRQQVVKEASYCCEYCKTSSRLTGTPLVMEHIIPRSLGGEDERENLAASCYRCNEFKGAKLMGLILKQANGSPVLVVITQADI